VVERQREVAGDGVDDASKHGGVLAESVAAGKRRPRTDRSDYLLPMSATAYLDVIDDTGQSTLARGRADRFSTQLFRIGNESVPKIV